MYVLTACAILPQNKQDKKLVALQEKAAKGNAAAQNEVGLAHPCAQPTSY